jgi:hypothetical protein
VALSVDKVPLKCRWPCGHPMCSGQGPKCETKKSSKVLVIINGMRVCCKGGELRGVNARSRLLVKTGIVLLKEEGLAQWVTWLCICQ